MLQGRVFGQVLKIETPIIASDTINYLTAKFVFETHDWDGLLKFAHFSNGVLSGDIPLDVEDEIKEEAGLNLTEGMWQLSLTGHDMDGGEEKQRITTVIVKFRVLPTLMKDGEPLPSIPSYGEQILSQVEEINEKLDSFTAEAETVPAGENATASYDPNTQVFSFGIPKGDKGDQGDKGDTGATGPSGTVSVGTTTTGDAGTQASVENVGTPTAAVLNFTIPKGDKGDQGDKGDTGNTGPSGTVAVGTTTTGNAGTQASVENVGTSTAAVLNFTIPKGDKGDKGNTGDTGAAATIAVGTTTTGNAGTQAQVENVGTSGAAILNFTIPKGDKGDKGNTGNTGSAATVTVGTVTTGEPGTDASVTNSGTTSAAVLNFVIPRGATGEVSEEELTAVETELKEAIDELTEFTKAEIEHSYTSDITATAGIGFNANTHIMDVNISSGTTYTIRMNDSVGVFDNGAYALYANGNVYVGAFYVNTDHTFTASADITFFGIYKDRTGVINSGTLKFDLSYAEENPNSLEEKVETLQSQELALESKTNTIEDDLINLNAFCRKNTEITFSNEVTATAGTGFNYADHVLDVNIPSGTEYTFKVIDPTGVFSIDAFFLYINGTYIGAKYVNTDYTITADSDVTYFSIYVTNETVVRSGTLTFEASYVLSYNPNSLEERVEKLEKKWDDLQWVCFGDSLTENNNRTTKHYFDYIAEKTGINIYNMGYSGSGYKHAEASNKAFYQRISSVPTTADVITIFGSFNDNSYISSALGTATDSGTNTIGGCVNTTLDNLFTAYPLAIVGIITPTPWENLNPLGEPNDASAYVNLLIEICKRRGIPYLDLFHDSLLRPWDSAFRTLAYSKDEGNGTHPDETGHKIIAPRIEAFLNSLLLH
jgi:lysophospholipase L1-like esterase